MRKQTKLNRQNRWATAEVDIHLANEVRAKQLVSFKVGFTLS